MSNFENPNNLGLRGVASANQLAYDKLTGPGELLLPVIVVEQSRLAIDGLGAIRMQGFANREAVQRTLDTRFATFYSRTREELWFKGETSGNTLRVVGAYTDCDNDVLLLDVKANGPTCHTGARSCFEIPTIGE